jgi:hypothetical protein
VEATRPDGWLRAVVVDQDNLSDWTGYADQIGARLAGDRLVQDVVDDLENRIADAISDSDRASDLSIAPWLIGIAAALWLLFFRRVRAP